MSLRRSGDTPPTMTLGRGEDRLMTWCSALNIYKVNRFHLFPLEGAPHTDPPTPSTSGGGLCWRTAPKRSRSWDLNCVDVVSQLLAHNMVEAAEAIFDHVGLKQTWVCRQVSGTWHEFITGHVFRRWAHQMVRKDAAPLKDDLSRYMAASEENAEAPADRLFFGRICRNLHNLRDCWRQNKARTLRIDCDSFVLSVCIAKRSSSGETLDPLVYCGLNNGDLQLWSVRGRDHSKVRQMEAHRKGVKCLGVEGQVMVTGSYDCTAKVWERSTWQLLHTITLHTDSVWEVKLKASSPWARARDPSIAYTFATAALDGSVAVFNILFDLPTGGGLPEGPSQSSRDTIAIQPAFVIQAHEDLVAAVDFDDSEDCGLLITGHEDSTIGIWDMVRKPLREGSCRLTRVLSGHAGGVTGIVINGNVMASSSYDGSVRLWSLRSFDCLRIFTEPDSLVRSLAFVGPMLACGDFGGSIHAWEVEVASPAAGGPRSDPKVTVKKHNQIRGHRGHVVCLQLTPTQMVSGSRDKTVLLQDFWLDDADYAAMHEAKRLEAAAAAAAEELSREEQRLLRRKNLLYRDRPSSLTFPARRLY